MQRGQIGISGGIKQQGEGRGRGVCGLVTLSDVVRTMRPLFPNNNNNNNNYSSRNSSSSSGYKDVHGNKIGNGETASVILPTSVPATDRGVVVLDTIYLPVRGFDTRSLTVPLLVLVRVVNRTLLPIFDVSVGVNHMHNEEVIVDFHMPCSTLSHIYSLTPYNTPSKILYIRISSHKNLAHAFMHSYTHTLTPPPSPYTHFHLGWSRPWN